MVLEREITEGRFFIAAQIEIGKTEQIERHGFICGSVGMHWLPEEAMAVAFTHIPTGWRIGLHPGGGGNEKFVLARLGNLDGWETIATAEDWMAGGPTVQALRKACRALVDEGLGLTISGYPPKP